MFHRYTIFFFDFWRNGYFSCILRIFSWKKFVSNVNQSPICSFMKRSLNLFWLKMRFLTSNEERFFYKFSSWNSHNTKTNCLFNFFLLTKIWNWTIFFGLLIDLLQTLLFWNRKYSYDSIEMEATLSYKKTHSKIMSSIHLIWFQFLKNHRIAVL